MLCDPSSAPTLAIHPAVTLVLLMVGYQKVQWWGDT